MQTGVVVVLDALGFKGIWKRHASELIVGKLKGMRDAVEKNTESFSGRFEGLGGGPVELRWSFLSDTIVFSIATIQREYPQANAANAAGAIAIAAHRTSLLMEYALQTDPRLSYRGCIAYGDFEIDYPFLLGEAIDEAAEYHERADGAFVWLAPSALAAWRTNGHFLQPEQFNMKSWAVPLKDIGSYETLAVHPPVGITEELLRTFRPGSRSVSLAVEIKRQNTEAFLNSLRDPGDSEVG